MRVQFNKEQWDAAAVKPEVFTRDGSKVRILATDTSATYGLTTPQPVAAIVGSLLISTTEGGLYYPEREHDMDLMMEVAYAPTDEERLAFVNESLRRDQSPYTHLSETTRQIVDYALRRIYDAESAAGKGAAE